jgi:hypothetical protein
MKLGMATGCAPSPDGMLIHELGWGAMDDALNLKGIIRMPGVRREPLPDSARTVRMAIVIRTRTRRWAHPGHRHAHPGARHCYRHHCGERSPRYAGRPDAPQERSC